MKHREEGSAYGQVGRDDQGHDEREEEQQGTPMTPAEMLNDWRPADEMARRGRLTPDALFEAGAEDAATATDGETGNYGSDYAQSAAGGQDGMTAPTEPDQVLSQSQRADGRSHEPYGSPVYTYSPSDEEANPELLEPAQGFSPSYYPADEIDPQAGYPPAQYPQSGYAGEDVHEAAQGQGETYRPGGDRIEDPGLPFYDYTGPEGDEGDGKINFTHEFHLLKEALKTILSIFRGFLSERPMQALKSAGQSNNSYVWILNSIFVIFLGALGGFVPSPYLELSYGRYYAKSLLHMLVSLLLPAAYYFLIRLCKRTDLKLNALLNVATTTVLPVMVFRLVSILFARLLPIVVAPLLVMASFVHFFLLHQAFKHDRFSKSKGYYWFMLAYVFVYLLLNDLLLPVVG